jgi:predicted membrane-bound mannosyltransferase
VEGFTAVALCEVVDWRRETEAVALRQAVEAELAANAAVAVQAAVGKFAGVASTSTPSGAAAAATAAAGATASPLDPVQRHANDTVYTVREEDFMLLRAVLVYSDRPPPPRSLERHELVVPPALLRLWDDPLGWRQLYAHRR